MESENRGEGRLSGLVKFQDQSRFLQNFATACKAALEVFFVHHSHRVILSYVNPFTCLHPCILGI